MSELCIMVAPNGARRTKSDHPELPISATELAKTARACFEQGASAIHLHVRDQHDRHSLDPETYRLAIAEIALQAPDIAIQVTTEAAGGFSLPEQTAAASELKPASLSFSFAELMREGPRQADRFLAFARDTGIAIQFILYDADQIAGFAEHMRAGKLHLTQRPRLLVVAGRYGVAERSSLAQFEDLYQALVVEGLHEEAVWMTCAFGSEEMDCLERTIALGGHVRVGFENAIVDKTGRLARDNAAQVEQVAQLARHHGCSLAKRPTALEVLGVKGNHPLI